MCFLSFPQSLSNSNLFLSSHRECGFPPLLVFSKTKVCVRRAQVMHADQLVYGLSYNQFYTQNSLNFSHGHPDISFIPADYASSAPDTIFFI